MQNATGTAFTIAAGAVEGSGLTMAFQPIFELRALVLGGQAIVGCEALARFEGGHQPDEIFTAAQAAGFGIELERRAAQLALESLKSLPAGIFVSINASPQLATSGALLELLRGRDSARVVVDLIEGGQSAIHGPAGGSDRLALALADLQELGVRIALDDTLGGSSDSLAELVLLPFDTIKVDRLIIRDVDKHAERAAQISALMQLATASGGDVIAEGIETADELAALIDIGIRFGQGYHLARPGPLDELLREFPGPRPESSTR
jgi:EAL domain-containing protein (putative c-di-GMP-specific phosphodiesterase class I)